MAKYIYSLVIQEWNERDSYERLEVRASYGTFNKALRATRNLIDNMLNSPYADYEVISDENLREFVSQTWAELYLPETGLHIRYYIMNNQLQ